MFAVLSGRSNQNSRSPLTVPVRLAACKGGLCFNHSSRVARLAGAPSLHVNRPLEDLLGDSFSYLDKLLLQLKYREIRR